MSWFRPSREKRDHDPFLEAKIGFFTLGAIIALIGIATETRWLINIAIGILLAGFGLRFVRKRNHTEADPPTDS